MERTISIDLPLTSEGMLGRQCPHCEHRFRIDAEEYRNQHYLNLSCPYCRWIADFDEFHTDEQVAYSKSVSMNELENMVVDRLEEVFGSGSVEGGLQDTTPQSPHFTEEVVDRICPDCGFGYQELASVSDPSCPVCRDYN